MRDQGGSRGKSTILATLLLPLHAYVSFISSFPWVVASYYTHSWFYWLHFFAFSHPCTTPSLMDILRAKEKIVVIGCVALASDNILARKGKDNRGNQRFDDDVRIFLSLIFFCPNARFILCHCSICVPFASVRFCIPVHISLLLFLLIFVTISPCCPSRSTVQASIVMNKILFFFWTVATIKEAPHVEKYFFFVLPVELFHPYYTPSKRTREAVSGSSNILPPFHVICSFVSLSRPICLAGTGSLPVHSSLLLYHGCFQLNCPFEQQEVSTKYGYLMQFLSSSYGDHLLLLTSQFRARPEPAEGAVLATVGAELKDVLLILLWSAWLNQLLTQCYCVRRSVLAMSSCIVEKGGCR